MHRPNLKPKELRVENSCEPGQWQTMQFQQSQSDQWTKRGNFGSGIICRWAGAF